MKPLSMLVVDDDPSTRSLLASIIRSQQPCRIHMACDGAEALFKCREHAYDIIWLDIEMPEKDGIATLKVLHSLNPQQFVVMVSAHGSVDYVKKSIEAGALGFIAKPYNIAKVGDIIKKFHDHRQREG